MVNKSVFERIYGVVVVGSGMTAPHGQKPPIFGKVMDFDRLGDAEVPSHAIVTRTSLALTIEALASRGESAAATAQPIFDALRRGAIPAEQEIPARYNGALAESVHRGQSSKAWRSIVATGRGAPVVH